MSVMVFVDGENLTIRGQALAQANSLNLDVDATHYLQNVFIWIPELGGLHNIPASRQLPGSLLRSYYYTSVVGDEQKVLGVRESLRRLQFDPQVFKKASGAAKSKGVDITLTKDMLSHAFLNNYEAAVLIAGDADYLPLIEEVKRRGKTVCVAFFGPGFGLAPELPLVADRFFDFTRLFIELWTKRIQALKR